MADTRHGQAFLTGLFGGALVGTVAGVLFAPQIYAAFKQLRYDLAEAVTDAGDAANGAYRDATLRAENAVDDLHEKGRGAYGKVLSVIIRGAEDVEERATEAQAQLDKGAAKAPPRKSS